MYKTSRIFVFLTLLMTQGKSVSGSRFPLTMPYVNPRLPNAESYLCTGVAVQASRELFITGWRPLASRDTVHHMMVIGCEAPVVTGLEVNLCTWVQNRQTVLKRCLEACYSAY